MRELAPLPSLNAHQCVEYLVHVEVERFSCIKIVILALVH
jgi:hypothetical protein